MKPHGSGVFGINRIDFEKRCDWSSLIWKSHKFAYLFFSSAPKSKLLGSADDFARQHSNSSNTGVMMDSTTLHHHHHHLPQSHSQQSNSSLMAKQIPSQQPLTSQGAGSKFSLFPRVIIIFLQFGLHVVVLTSNLYILLGYRNSIIEFSEWETRFLPLLY